MDVTLVLPRLEESADRFFAQSRLSGLFRKILGLGGSNHIPPLSLMYLAAVTPPGVDIHLIDERFEDIDYERPTDLVGISVVTRAATRAYHISQRFRERGVPVVLGGIHPSVMQEEALSHADAIVTGEGEGVWPQVVEDAGNGRLGGVYHRSGVGEFTTLPRIRRDILRDPSRYLTSRALTATRGCPRGCTFCSVGFGTGKKHRTRGVGEVIDELRATGTRGSAVYFADENMAVDLEYTKELLHEMIPLRLRWYGEMEVAAFEDGELVDLMGRSGCVSIQTGFDSLDPAVLKAIRKDRTNDSTRYVELVRRLHEAGVVVAGSLIVGFDGDAPPVFDQMYSFIQEANIEMPSINTLIPYPGTRIYRDFLAQGRLLTQDWNLYDTAAGFVVFQPKKMTPYQLASGYVDLCTKVHAGMATAGRLARAKTQNVRGTLLALHYNRQKKLSVAEEWARVNAGVSGTLGATIVTR